MAWFIKNKFIKKDCSVSLNFKRLDLSISLRKNNSHTTNLNRQLFHQCVYVYVILIPHPELVMNNPLIEQQYFMRAGCYFSKLLACSQYVQSLLW